MEIYSPSTLVYLFNELIKDKKIKNNSSLCVTFLLLCKNNKTYQLKNLLNKSIKLSKKLKRNKNKSILAKCF